MNLGDYLSRSAAYWPDAEALVWSGQRWTYRRLEAEANQLASALQGRGCLPGTAVATLAANRGELVVAEMALCKAGAVRVPISTRLAPAEVEHVLVDAGVEVVLVDAKHRHMVCEIADRRGLALLVVDFDAAGDGDLAFPALLAEGDPSPVSVDVPAGHPAVLNFTSGSTGTLKAAVQTVGNRLSNMRKMAMNPQATLSKGSVYLVAGPITHASGMGILGCFFRGATVVVLSAFDVESYLDTLEREKVTQSFLVPVMLNRVLASPTLGRRNFPHLRSITIGGAPVAPARLREAVEAFGPVISQGYGQGETTSTITFLTIEDVLRGIESDPDLLLSCGRAVFDTEVRVVDPDGRPLPPGEVGELLARGPDCVQEYFHAPEATAELLLDGWVRTGDLGYIREDGYIFLVDRKKDMIISGGYNIYCTEVEASLYDHPGVFEACVVGVPDEQWGETVKAFVSRAQGTSVSEEELRDFCSQRLSRVKVPRIIEFVEDLPRNRNGKLDRRLLREREWSGSERRVG
ncbi:AMP-dependent synthetase and ligase [Sinomonas atrocyanea]|uniref:AMP-dependent synthetase and ligase n=1 Tax=Sinomonas atrocyanea TaxID=37927 RepID=A0A127A173_9MICC|nr:AMP-binding protein [Sinomonas atrocyanea]AMM32917.1 AMP-dependent synthetase and ligase [Sinomonas atrocyanea]GEB65038.1 ligase [Sinomonas atrocyanea]GGG61290.1 ligase [Sinomonas atrocyanea]